MLRPKKAYIKILAFIIYLKTRLFKLNIEAAVVEATKDSINSKYNISKQVNRLTYLIFYNTILVATSAVLYFYRLVKAARVVDYKGDKKLKIMLKTTYFL